MKQLLQKLFAEIRLTALYAVLFPLYFGIGWGLDHLPIIFSRPLAFVFLLYVPALLMLLKTRSRAQAFTLATMRDGIYLMAIFAAIYLAEHFLQFLEQRSPFQLIYPVLLCVKTISVFRVSKEPAAEKVEAGSEKLEARNQKVEARRKKGEARG